MISHRVTQRSTQPLLQRMFIRQRSTLVVLFLALVDLRGFAEILEVEKIDKMLEKVDAGESQEVANDERKRRQALGGDFGQHEVEKQNSRKKRDGRKSSAIRINQKII